MPGDVRKILSGIWHEGVAAVSGKNSVITELRLEQPFEPDLVIAVGKAASSMCVGALSTVPAYGKAIVVTKADHVLQELQDFPNVKVIEAGHPIPNEDSIRAGELILQSVQELKSEQTLLMLVSGGASALVEALPADMSLRVLQDQTQALIASGKTIGEINGERARASLLKGGKLLQEFKGAELRVYAISDVQGDDLGVIGSGIGCPEHVSGVNSSRVIANNAMARGRAATAAAAAGFLVQHNKESLYDDVFGLAPQIAAILVEGDAGIYIWGGEPVIELPSNPGKGGRNQSLALAIARCIAGRTNITVLVAGTDGTDGPTQFAGAIIDGDTCQDSDAADRALAEADAGAYLERCGAIFETGPTDTNVMDMVVALVG